MLGFGMSSFQDRSRFIYSADQLASQGLFVWNEMFLLTAQQYARILSGQPLPTVIKRQETRMAQSWKYFATASSPLYTLEY